METKPSLSHGAHRQRTRKRNGARNNAGAAESGGLAATIRLAIFDRDPEFRKGVKLLLNLQPHLSVVADAASLDELNGATEIDICLLYGSGSEIDEISAAIRRGQVILIVPGEQREESLGALRVGVRGVVFKRLAIDALLSAIDAVSAGHVWVPPTLQASIVAGMRQPAVTNLTSREREITQLVARGLRNAEIAARLYISEQTVKTHLNNVFHKLELRDRVELALYATRNGIVDAREQFSPGGRTARSAA